MRFAPLAIAATLTLIMSGCSTGGPQTIVADGAATDVGSITELVDAIDALGYECDFDQTDETVGSIESGMCTVSDGDVYISVFDDPDKQQKIAGDDEITKGDANLQGGNWYISGPDDVLENLFDKGTGHQLITASGRFCEQDGELQWCP